MGVDTINSAHDQDGLFDIPKPPSLDEIRDAAAAGGRAAARPVEPEPRGVYDYKSGSSARDEETSDSLRDSETDNAIELAQDAQAARAQAERLEDALNVRAADQAALSAARARGTQEIELPTPPETFAERTLRESRERNQANLAAVEADPSIREADLELSRQQAANARMMQDRIQTPEQAAQVAKDLREARARGAVEAATNEHPATELPSDDHHPLAS